MWQNIIVFTLIALAAGITAWKFYAKLTGRSSCCGGTCACSPSNMGCSSCSGPEQNSHRHLTPLTGSKPSPNCPH